MQFFTRTGTERGTGQMPWKEQLLVFAVLPNQEIFFHDAVKAGLFISNPGEFTAPIQGPPPTHSMITRVPYIKIFLKREAFGEPKLWASIYIKMLQSGPGIQIRPFSGTMLPFSFVAVHGKVLDFRTIEGIAPAESLKFLKHQRPLPPGIITRFRSAPGSPRSGKIRTIL